MGNLAGTFSALGRHNDALVMGERTLEFQRRVLPANNPCIGEGCLGCVACGAMIVTGLICFNFTCQAWPW